MLNFFAAEVTGHLAAAAIGIFRLGEGRQHAVTRRLSKYQHKPQVAVVRTQEVLVWLQGKSGAYLCGFLPLARNDERHLACSIQQPLAFIDFARQQHVIIHIDHLRIGKSHFFMAFASHRRIPSFTNCESLCRLRPMLLP